jgi:alpha-glucosidase
MARLDYRVIDRNILEIDVDLGGRRLPSFVVPENIGSDPRARGYWRVDLRGDAVLVSWGNAVDIEFSSITTRGDYVVILHPLRGGDHVYGLGEKYGLSIDRRFRRFHVWNAPQPHHLPSGDPMYLSVPLIIVARPGRAYGFYIDYPGYIYVDTGVARQGELEVRVMSKSFRIYVIAGGSVADLAEAYSRLTGRPFMPPKWALGYHQSRYSYMSQAEVLDVARRFRELGIPGDAIYLDIDYMDGYKVFTWDKERFPDPHGLARELRRLGFRLVTIIDVGVKAERGYHAFDEGVRLGAFTRNSRGGLFRGGVWPGYCVFPDFYNARARDYWARLVSRTLRASTVSGLT